MVGGLTEVKCAHRTIRGLIESNWSAKDGKLEFKIVIPPGTEAQVWLPGQEGDVLTEGGKPINDADGVDGVDFSSVNNCHRLKLGSGSYHFTITK